jgi:hypothetical protein
MKKISMSPTIFHLPRFLSTTSAEGIDLTASMAITIAVSHVPLYGGLQGLSALQFFNCRNASSASMYLGIVITSHIRSAMWAEVLPSPFVIYDLINNITPT